MGTNFYLRGKRNSDDPSHHVGKRSAAGPYCWDCGVTLCMLGMERLHYSKGKQDWHVACPKCGQCPIQESLTNSSGGRELGFNRTPPQKKKGVRSCSSFSWGMDPDSILKRKKSNRKIIENEYGDLFTLDKFKQILRECPIQYHHSIGVLFS